VFSPEENVTPLNRSKGNYELKFKILKSAKNLRTTDGLKNFSINQDLTKSRDELAFMARQYVRKKSTWVIDGKVYVTTNGDKKYVPGNNLSGTIRSTIASAMTNLNISNFHFNSNLFNNINYFARCVFSG
jgi:hypothetical protein